VEPVEEGERHLYYRAYIADVVEGDQPAAQSKYQQMLAFGPEAPALVAQAALRLALWAEQEGQRVKARDLALRASVLGADLPFVFNAASQLRVRTAASSRARSNPVRGPQTGPLLRTVPANVMKNFREAEGLLSQYHRRRIKPRLEELSASINQKRAAMKQTIRAYRKVTGSQVPEAVVAAEFRIASVYYDYSLSLTFELPDELDPEVSIRLLNSLQSEVREVRSKARSAYERSLKAADLAKGAEVKVWQEAARVGLASVRDFLPR
jgi:hypothetical protein